MGKEGGEGCLGFLRNFFYGEGSNLCVTAKGP